MNYVGGGTLNLDGEDYFIIENGKIVTFDTIQAGDVLRDRGEDVYEITAAKSGKFSTYSDSKVTLDGVRYANNKLAVYDAEYDSDTLDDYIGTEVLYAVNSNNSVTTIIAQEAGSSSTLYGVITKLSRSTDNIGENTDEVETLTIFNQEGKSTKYDVKSEVAYVDLGGDYDRDPEKDYFEIGSAVEFKVDKDNVIKSMKPVTDQDNTDYKAIELTGENAVAKTDDDTNRITLDGNRYTVTDNTYIFNITEDGSDYDVELLSKSDVITGDDIDAGETFGAEYIYAKIDGTRVVALFVTNIDAAGDKYGFVEELNARNSDGDYTIKFYGNDTYYVIGGNPLKTDDSSEAISEDDFVRYTTTGDDLDTIYVEKITPDTKGDEVTDVDNGLLSYGNTSAEMVSDTVYYEIEFTGKVDKYDVEISVITADDITDGDYVVVKKDDGDAVVVVRVVDNTDKSAVDEEEGE